MKNDIIHTLEKRDVSVEDREMDDNILVIHCSSSTNLYAYFDNVDDLIVQSTAYCMLKVEDEFMEKAPKNAEALERFFNEILYWTAKNHRKNIV